MLEALTEIGSALLASALLFCSLCCFAQACRILCHGTENFDPWWETTRGVHVDQKTNTWVATERAPKWIINE